MIDHSQRAHSNLGASGADRWGACPGSVPMSEGLEDKGSIFADEGTAAHQLGDRCFNENCDADKYIETTITVHGNEFEVTTEMAEAVQMYLDVVRADITPGAEFENEQRLDLSELHPEMFGTGDALIYTPANGVLQVFDFKYGRGIAVTAEESWQLLYYGIGAALKYHNRGISAVELIIVQPRCPHPEGPIRRWTTDALRLLEFSHELIDMAEVVDAARVLFDPRDDIGHALWLSKYTAAGEHCRFCRAAPICPTLRELVMQSAMADFTSKGEIILSKPETFSALQLGKILTEVGVIESWIKRVQEFAHHEAEAGRFPVGFKLVPKRPARKFKDKEVADFHILTELEVAEEDLLLAPKPRSVAQIEAVLKEKYGYKAKSAKEAIAHLVEAVSSGAVLAPEDDPRESVRSEAESDFTAV